MYSDDGVKRWLYEHQVVAVAADDHHNHSAGVEVVAVAGVAADDHHNHSAGVEVVAVAADDHHNHSCLLYTSPSPRD